MTLTHSAVADASMTQMFAALDGLLDKAAKHAAARDVAESVFLDWRLAPDMFPMSRQVQIATEISARGMARLAGAPMPSFADDEKSFDDLRARVGKARAFIKALDTDKIDADSEGEVTFPVGEQTMTMKRRDYLLNFVLPNLYFHVTTTYALLRACGAPLGKADFLAGPR